jgi:nitrogen fixation NifU-like protein
MGKLNQLYQDLIVRHSQVPSNYRDMPASTHSAEKHNPLCGDDLELMLAVDGALIVDAAFQGSACAVCTSSASMMTSAISGLQVLEAMMLAGKFEELFEEGAGDPGVEWLSANHPDLLAFRGIREFPIRIQCARLPWEALSSAIHVEGAGK